MTYRTNQFNQPKLISNMNDYRQQNKLNQIKALQTWGDYVLVNGTALPGTGPSITVDNNNVPWASVIGSDGTSIYVTDQSPSGAWTFPWTVITGGSSANTPAIEAFNGDIYSIVVGMNSHVYISSRVSGTWSAYTPIPVVITVLAGTGVSTSVFNNRLYVAITSTDHNTHIISMDTIGGWSVAGWTSVPNIPNKSSTCTPALSPPFNGKMHLMTIATDGSIWINSMDVSNTWGTWNQVSGSAYACTGIYGDINGDGIVDVSDALLISQYVAGQRTLDACQLHLADVNGDGIVDATDATYVGNYTVGSQPSGRTGQFVGGGASLTTDKVLLYASVIGSDGHGIYETDMDATGTWTFPWTILPGSATGSPAIRYYNGKLNSMVISTNGSIWVDSAPLTTLTSILVNPTSATVAINSTQQFSATCKDQNGNVMTCPTLTWDTTDHTVGTVNSSGLFTAGSPSSLPATVTVKATGGTIVGSSVVTIAAETPTQSSNAGIVIVALGIGILAIALMKKE